MPSRRTVLMVPALLLPGLTQLAAPAAAQTTPKRIRGTIESLDGNVLSVRSNGGEALKVNLAPNFTVGALVQTTIDKIKPGSMIGIVGVGPAKTQRAVAINIFPPGAAVNEAQFAWDSVPESTMTNAPVTADVAGTDGRTLTVTVKGEPVQVTVPPNAIIQETEPGTPAMLVPGAKVIIFAQQAADGSISAPRVNVGKNGFTPAN